MKARVGDVVEATTAAEIDWAGGRTECVDCGAFAHLAIPRACPQSGWRITALPPTAAEPVVNPELTTAQPQRTTIECDDSDCADKLAKRDARIAELEAALAAANKVIDGYGENEPPVVRGALDAQEAAEKSAFATRGANTILLDRIAALDAEVYMLRHKLGDIRDVLDESEDAAHGPLKGRE